jgi:hypothetical protein
MWLRPISLHHLFEAESFSAGRGVGGVAVAKVGHKWGNFGNAGTDHRQLGALQMKIVSQRREQVKWGTMACVFEAKMEIPAKTNSV